MIQELESYEAQQKSQKTNAVKKMLNLMNQYYANLKSDVGIEDQAGIDDEDYELDDILRTLKPNTTAKNFKEFLKREDNCTKTQAWRGISRKIYQDEQNSLQKVQEGEEGPFEAQNLRVAALVDAYQSNYRSVNQPLLEEPKPHQLLSSIAMGKQEARAA